MLRADPDYGCTGREIFPCVVWLTAQDNTEQHARWGG